MRRLTLLAVALTLAGCAAVGTPAVPAPAAPPAVVHAHWPGCAALGDFRMPYVENEIGGDGSVPADFRPVSAVSCQTGERTSAAGDTVEVALERTATDIGRLVVYVARPSQVAAHPETLTCSAVAYLKPWLFLLDAAGRWVNPRLPTDACGEPLDVSAVPGPAYEDLVYTDRVVQTLRVTKTAAALRAGCEMQWKDVVQLEATEGSPRRAAIGADPLTTGPVRRCVFVVPTDPRAADSGVGSFERGGRLTPAERERLVAALRGSPAAGTTCRQQARRFALLQAEAGGPDVYVELGGCRRVLVEDSPSRLAQGSTALVDLLAG